MKNFRGFSLAEVLIVLGVLGIVASMTLPPLIVKYQKQVTVSRLQKFYSVFNQALKMSEVDHGDYKFWNSSADFGGILYFNEYWKPYLSILNICRTGKDCGYNSNTPWKDIKNKSTVGTAIIEDDGRIAFYLSDGIFILMLFYLNDEANNTKREVPSFLVDINGSKRPNRVGQDLFYFERVSQGETKGIMPTGYNKTKQEIISNCSKNSGDGRYCSAKIIQDGWEITDDYPW